MNTEVFSNKEYEQSVINAIPLRRIATADDVALSIILASDWSRHITGEILNLNGGSVLCG
jgi:3-oxoacyl-[acyl-carrier protein] reductase